MTTGPRLSGRFHRLWLAASISYLGDGMALVAFPLLAVKLTTSPMLVAGTQVARGIPFLVLGVVAGVYADRADRRRLMVGVDTARALAVGLLAVLVATDNASIALVFVIIFLLACGETLFDPAAASFIPNVVDVPQLERANGRLIASESTAKELLGPALGAVLFALAAWLPFGFDGLSFAVAALLVATIPGAFRPVRQIATDGHAPTFRQELTAGWRFLRANSVLRTLALVGMSVNFAAAAVEATLVLFALDVLHTGNVGYGLLLAGAAVAGIAAAMTTNRVTRHIGAGTVMIGGHIAAGVAAVAAALTSNAFVCAGALAIVFACTAWGDVVRFSLRQELTPDVLRGRVYSLIRTAMWGVWPIGALVGGLLAEWSLRAPFLLFAIVSVAVGVIATPLLGNRAVARARADAHAEEIDMHGDDDVDLPRDEGRDDRGGGDQIGVPGATSGHGH